MKNWVRDILARTWPEVLIARDPKAYMRTFTGLRYYPAAPRSCDVRIVDIAHHESMLCRFTGAVKTYYSVAEHSVYVSLLVPPEMALIGLLHDATEAYVNDLNRPLKRSCPDYQRIEALNWAVIAAKFGLPLEMPSEIKTADNAIMITERNALLTPDSDAWTLDMPGGVEPKPADMKIQCWSPERAENEFMIRFYELTRGKPQVVTFPSYPVIPRMAACFTSS